VSEDEANRRLNGIDVHVGSRVRLRRMELGLSQNALGNSLRLTVGQIQKYETGVNRIGAGRLFELAHALGVPITFFFEDLLVADQPTHE
jgi:transcriptional regulator with XRE-family HTH domain